MAVLPAVLLFYAAMAPAEARLVIAEQTLYAPRLVGFALLPVLAFRLARNPIRWSVWDLVYIGACFWMILAFIANYGATEGIRRGFALAADAFIPYLAARTCFRDINDLRRFLLFAAPGLLIVSLSLIAEVIAGRLLVRPLAASIFSALPTYEGDVQVGTNQMVSLTRLGFLRAPGPFVHPILAGLFLATLLPLYYWVGIRGWPRLAGLFASMCAILSVSSTALLALIAGAGVIALEYGQRFISFITWKMILPVIGAALLTLHFLTEQGLIRFLGQFTLNPGTAHYRRMIWNHATDSVERHPWFGIGFDAYQRLDWMVVSSVDAHWLLLAVRFGLVPSIFMFAVTVAAIVMVGLGAARSIGVDRNAHIALSGSLLCVLLAGFTVTFFGGVQAWLYMLIGIGISIGVAAKGAVRPMRRPAGRQPRQLRPRTTIPQVQPRTRP